ncbi:MAG: adenylyltransferase/cytidyltransferase family protein, partial [Nitrospirae bacterium]|nr:adenylyltransferase/cytidyltransferase family protein [Nitrospirota bacterium]
MKLGIFGGTFNPIHYGHLRVAEEVKEKLGLNKIIFVPSGNPPLKGTELADAKHR